MNINFIQEPDLEFGAGRHVDVRFGIKNYGPLDRLSGCDARLIRLGIVGTSETVEGIEGWLTRCRSGIAAKLSRQPNLFPAFPGFGESSPFHASFLIENRCQRTIKNSEFVSLARITDRERLLEETVALFLAEIKYLANETAVEVVICALPNHLLQLLEPDEVRPTGVDSAGEDSAEPRAASRLDFRNLLKARAIPLRIPVQVVLPTTYGGKARKPQKTEKGGARRLQDEATRAWNFHVALYYKGGGTPWRLVRYSSDFTTCYVGIAFFRSLDRERVHTSLAQVFDERGDGVIIRGGDARFDKNDRVPHLSDTAAHDGIAKALSLYRQEHKTMPARVVIHKTSSYTGEEAAGFLAGIKSLGIDQTDLVSVRRSYTRLFRHGAYPPLRGTLLSLDQRRQVLYTKGSVSFFETYPGMYVPLPLELEIHCAEQTPTFLAAEILALTKMNWNSTQFDNAHPITILAADQVGDVLKYVNHDDPIHPRYSFYM
jgi:hypothetical protein